VRIADDDHAVGGVAPRIAPAQNRRPLAEIAQPRGDECGERRLRPAAGGEIADADDGP
jgi:hypothetical protein